MWTIIKFEKSKFEFLRNDLEKKLEKTVYFISLKYLTKKGY